MQNSSRTKFYKRFIIKNVEWSSTETALEPGQRKSDFDKDPVYDQNDLNFQDGNPLELKEIDIFVVKK